MYISRCRPWGNPLKMKMHILEVFAVRKKASDKSHVDAGRWDDGAKF